MIFLRMFKGSISIVSSLKCYYLPGEDKNYLFLVVLKKVASGRLELGA